MIRVDASELQKIDELLRKLGASITDEIYDSVQVSLNTFRQSVVARTPVDRGTLRESITTQVSGLSGKVVTPLVYGVYVENGRKPGRMPPLEVIEQRVIRKLGVTPPKSRSVAYLIARAIGKKGTRAARMFRRGFSAAEKSVVEYWRGFPSRVFERMGR